MIFAKQHLQSFCEDFLYISLTHLSIRIVRKPVPFDPDSKPLDNS